MNWRFFSLLPAQICFALVLLFASNLAARAEVRKCDVCGKTIVGEYFTVTDQAEGKQKTVCPSCKTITSECFVCGLPVVDGYQRLPDGRFICGRDWKNIISSEDDAKQICHDVKDALDRLLSRYMAYPADDTIQLAIVDKFRLESLFSAPGNENSCVWVYGATSTHRLSDKKHIHTVEVLSHLLKPRLQAVAAHEFTHAWQYENISPDRRAALDRNMVEAFCELIAYTYMESLGETNEMTNIVRNNYTVGKISVLIAARDAYGFNNVIEWMKNGEANTLTMETIDRVRALKDGRSSPSAPSPTYTAAPTLVYGTKQIAAPTTLVLKSISGSRQHPFALINSTTFEPNEKEKIRVGTNTLSVVCLEIYEDSVVIQVDGAKEKKQLFLRGQ